MIYQHEARERKPQGAINTVWPEMSSNGRDFDACKQYLKGRNLSFDFAEANGWYPSRNAGDFVLRLVMPAKTWVPDHVYWQARAVHASAYRYQSPRGPRYDALIYVSADPLDIDPEPSSLVVVVEGPMDALAAAECGYDSVALMGITPPESTLQRLVELVNHRPTLVVLDAEPEASAQSLIISAWLNGKGINSRNAVLANINDLAKCDRMTRKKFLNESFWFV